ncbi:MAG: thioesterase [Cycloclasticus sp. symbiont of Bathymodiolus heckerae]|nr:MAG: thioesterase [Cycloclasticus sp. symbiont of Bathymodiolus heckerae]
MARLSITYPENSLFACSLPVRITDINYGQHLAHDKLISMLHEARAQFFINFGMEESNVAGLGIILSDLAICYQAESFHPDILDIEIALDDPSRCGCDMVYRVSKDNGKTIVATAKTGLVFFDYNHKKVASIPNEFKKLLNA